jgi:hypothetical protein
MPNYSLDSVSINGFRGLRNLRLDGLGLINVLVGENNSGKTSVLEAMSVLCDPFNPYEWLSLVYRRDFGGLDENRVQSLRWCFHQHGELKDSEAMFEGECEMTCSGRFPVRKLLANYKDISGEPDPAELKRIAQARGLMRPIRKKDLDQAWRGAELTHYVESDAPIQRTLFETPGTTTIEPVAIQIWEGLPYTRRAIRRRQRIESATLTPYSYQINRLQVRYQSEQFFVEGRRDLVLDLVREFDPDIQGVSVESLFGGRPAIYLQHRRLGPAPLSTFGDALRRAVLLANTIPVLQGGGVLLIDELETGIHVTALGRLFSWLVEMARKLGMQIVATTHSLEAVDAVAVATASRIEDLVTFHLKQTGEETQVKRYAGDLLQRLRGERGLDLR